MSEAEEMSIRRARRAVMRVRAGKSSVATPPRHTLPTAASARRRYVVATAFAAYVGLPSSSLGNAERATRAEIAV